MADTKKKDKYDGYDLTEDDKIMLEYTEALMNKKHEIQETGRVATTDRLKKETSAEWEKAAPAYQRSYEAQYAAYSNNKNSATDLVQNSVESKDVKTSDEMNRAARDAQRGLHELELAKKQMASEATTDEDRERLEQESLEAREASNMYSQIHDATENNAAVIRQNINANVSNYIAKQLQDKINNGEVVTTSDVSRELQVMRDEYTTLYGDSDDYSTKVAYGYAMDYIDKLEADNNAQIAEQERIQSSGQYQLWGEDSTKVMSGFAYQANAQRQNTDGDRNESPFNTTVEYDTSSRMSPSSLVAGTSVGTFAPTETTVGEKSFTDNTLLGKIQNASFGKYDQAIGATDGLHELWTSLEEYGDMLQETSTPDTPEMRRLTVAAEALRGLLEQTSEDDIGTRTRLQREIEMIDAKRTILEQAPELYDALSNLSTTGVTTEILDQLFDVVNKRGAGDYEQGSEDYASGMLGLMLSGNAADAATAISQAVSGGYEVKSSYLGSAVESYLMYWAIENASNETTAMLRAYMYDNQEYDVDALEQEAKERAIVEGKEYTDYKEYDVSNPRSDDILRTMIFYSDRYAVHTNYINDMYATEPERAVEYAKSYVEADTEYGRRYEACAGRIAYLNTMADKARESGDEEKYQEIAKNIESIYEYINEPLADFTKVDEAAAARLYDITKISESEDVYRNLADEEKLEEWRWSGLEMRHSYDVTSYQIPGGKGIYTNPEYDADSATYKLKQLDQQISQLQKELSNDPAYNNVGGLSIEDNEELKDLYTRRSALEKSAKEEAELYKIGLEEIANQDWEWTPEAKLLGNDLQSHLVNMLNPVANDQARDINDTTTWARTLVMQMNEDERNIFDTYLGYGKETGDYSYAQDYFSALEYDLQRREAEYETAWFETYSASHPIKALAVNAGMEVIPAFVTGTQSLLLEFTNRLTVSSHNSLASVIDNGYDNTKVHSLSNTALGTTTRRNSGTIAGWTDYLMGNTPSLYGSDMTRSQFMRATEGDPGSSPFHFSREAAEFWAGTIVSIANNAAQSGLFRIGSMMGVATALDEAIPLAMMGTIAGTQKMQEMLNNGVDFEHAYKTSAVVGMMEILTEKVSMDAYISRASGEWSQAFMKKFGASSVAKGMTNKFGNYGAMRMGVMGLLGIASQGASELTEEVTSEVVDTMVDIWYNGERSDYMRSVNSYIAQGMTARDAYKQANIDLADNVKNAALGGLASGVIMGGAATPAMIHNTALTGKIAMRDNGYLTLAERAVRTMNQTSDSYRLGEEILSMNSQGRHVGAIEVSQFLYAFESDLKARNGVGVGISNFVTAGNRQSGSLTQFEGDLMDVSMGTFGDTTVKATRTVQELNDTVFKLQQGMMSIDDLTSEDLAKFGTNNENVREYLSSAFGYNITDGSDAQLIAALNHWTEHNMDEETRRLILDDIGTIKAEATHEAYNNSDVLESDDDIENLAAEAGVEAMQEFQENQYIDNQTDAMANIDIGTIVQMSDDVEEDVGTVATTAEEAETDDRARANHGYKQSDFSNAYLSAFPEGSDVRPENDVKRAFDKFVSSIKKGEAFVMQGDNGRYIMAHDGNIVVTTESELKSSIASSFGAELSEEQFNRLVDTAVKNRDAMKSGGEMLSVATALEERTLTASEEKAVKNADNPKYEPIEFTKEQIENLGPDNPNPFAEVAAARINQLDSNTTALVDYGQLGKFDTNVEEGFFNELNPDGSATIYINGKLGASVRTETKGGITSKYFYTAVDTVAYVASHEYAHAHLARVARNAEAAGRAKGLTGDALRNFVDDEKMSAMKEVLGNYAAVSGLMAKDGENWMTAINKKAMQIIQSRNETAIKENNDKYRIGYIDALEEVYCNSLGEMLQSFGLMREMTESRGHVAQMLKYVKNFLIDHTPATFTKIRALTRNYGDANGTALAKNEMKIYDQAARHIEKFVREAIRDVGNVTSIQEDMDAKAKAEQEDRDLVDELNDIDVEEDADVDVSKAQRAIDDELVDEIFEQINEYNSVSKHTASDDSWHETVNESWDDRPKMTDDEFLAAFFRKYSTLVSLDDDYSFENRFTDGEVGNVEMLKTWLDTMRTNGKNTDIIDRALNGESVNLNDLLQAQVDMGECTNLNDVLFNGAIPNGGVFVTYHSMQYLKTKDGRTILTAPMAGTLDGKYGESSEFNKWEVAQENPHLIKFKDGLDYTHHNPDTDYGMFSLKKGDGTGDCVAVYDPYMHSSNLMINDQFSGAYQRPNLVTIKCYAPVSEMFGTYHAGFSKLRTGWTEWHEGPVAGDLDGTNKRNVYLSRYLMPISAMDNNDVAEHYGKLIGGTDIFVPDNVVPPTLLKSLKSLSLPIDHTWRLEFGDFVEKREACKSGSKEYKNFTRITSFFKKLYEAHGKVNTTFKKWQTTLEEGKSKEKTISKLKAEYTGALEKYQSMLQEAVDLCNEYDIDSYKDYLKYDNYVDRFGEELYTNGASNKPKFSTATPLDSTPNTDPTSILDNVISYTGSNADVGNLTTAFNKIITRTDSNAFIRGSSQAMDRMTERATEVAQMIYDGVENSEYTVDMIRDMLMDDITLYLVNTYEQPDPNAYYARMYEAIFRRAFHAVKYANTMGSTFSGTGTLEAAMQAVIKGVFANEFDPALARGYISNFGCVAIADTDSTNPDKYPTYDLSSVNLSQTIDGKHTMMIGDVQKVGKNADTLPDCYWFHCSPVCHNFSTAKNNAVETTLDRTTAQACADIIAAKKPPVVTVENVVHYKKSDSLKLITDKLTELGYDWQIVTVRDADYGGATKRKRMFVRAVRDGTLPPMPAYVNNTTNWWDAISDRQGQMEEWHITDGVKERFEYERSKAKYRNNPISLDPTEIDKPLLVYGGTKDFGLTTAWADGLFPTITANNNDGFVVVPPSYSNDGEGHILKLRSEELKLIQGLPSDFVLPASETDAVKVIGNGISPRMTCAVVSSLLDTKFQNEEARKTITEQIDNKYLEAVESGDEEEYTRLFNEYVLEQADENIVPVLYATSKANTETRETANALRAGDAYAIETAAQEIAKVIPNSSDYVLVPMPNSKGTADNTLELAEAISEITGQEVYDVLKGASRKRTHRPGKSTLSRRSEQYGMEADEYAIPEGKTPLIIDDVIYKGTTAQAAVHALQGGISVAYYNSNASRWVTTDAGNAKYYPIKSAEVVTYDDNGNVIPLSKRFNLKNPDVRYSVSEDMDSFSGVEEDSFSGVEERMKNPYRSTKWSIAGTLSETADLDALRRAEEMQSEGATPEEIWKETGWYVGADDRWKYEIKSKDWYVSHDYLRVIGESGDVVKLVDILDADNLFEAYPQLQDFRVAVDYLDGTSGASDLEKRAIVLDSFKVENDEIDTRETLIHEIQHMIQYIEGFDNGSSPEYFDDTSPIISGYRYNWEYAERKLGDVFEKLQSCAENNRSLRELNREFMKYYRVAKKASDIRVEANEKAFTRGIDEFKRLREEADTYENEINFAKENYQRIYEDNFESSKTGELDDAGTYMHYANQIERLLDKRSNPEARDSFELYENTTGEIEARDAEFRDSWITSAMPNIGNPIDNIRVPSPKMSRDKYSTLTKLDEDYDNAVKSGDMETAQRMVDEAARDAGYTDRMYHGTPYGGFNKFKDWQYFTSNKEYADLYQNPSKSSIRGRYPVATNQMTYGVYVKADNVFDTRNEDVMRVYEDEFYNSWSRTPLAESGVPDWTDGIDLVEFIEENGYDYDAIVLDEGGTPQEDGSVKKHGLSMIVKNSSQIKSADPVTYDDNGNVIPLSERFDNTNPDIRYSVAGKLDDNFSFDNGITITSNGKSSSSWKNSYTVNLPNGQTIEELAADDNELKSLVIMNNYARFKYSDTHSLQYLHSNRGSMWELTEADSGKILMKTNNYEKALAEFNKLSPEEQTSSVETPTVDTTVTNEDSMFLESGDMFSPRNGAKVLNAVKAKLGIDRVFDPVGRAYFCRFAGSQEFLDRLNANDFSVIDDIVKMANQAAEYLNQENGVPIKDANTAIAEAAIEIMAPDKKWLVHRIQNAVEDFYTKDSDFAKETTQDNMTSQTEDAPAYKKPEYVVVEEMDDPVIEKETPNNKPTTANEKAVGDTPAKRSQSRAKSETAKRKATASAKAEAKATTEEQKTAAKKKTAENVADAMVGHIESMTPGQMDDEAAKVVGHEFTDRFKEEVEMPKTEEEYKELTPNQIVSLVMKDIMSRKGKGQRKLSDVYNNTYKRMNILDEVNKNNEAIHLQDGTYDEKTNKASLETATKRLEDNYSYWYETLPTIEEWGAEELDTAMLILANLSTESAVTKDYKEAKRFADLVYRKGNRAGQMIQAFKKWNETATGILVKAMQNADKMDINSEQNDSVFKGVENDTTSMEAHNSEMEEEVKRIQGLLDEMTAERDRLLAWIAGVDGTEESSSDVTQLQEDLKRANEEVARLEAEQKRLRKRLAKRRNVYRGKRGAEQEISKKKVDAAQKEFDEKTKEVKDAKAKRDALAKQLNSLEGRTKTLAARLIKYNEKIKELTPKVEEAKKAHADALAKKEAAQTKANELKAKLKSLEGRTETARKRTDTLNSETIPKLTEDLRQAEEEYTYYNSRYEEALEKYRPLKEELDNTRKSIDSIRGKIKTTKKNIESAPAKMLALTMELETLRKQYQEEYEKWEKLNEKIRELSAQRSDLNNKNRNLTKRHANAVAKQAKLEKQLETLRNTYEAMKNAVELLNSKNKDRIKSEINPAIEQLKRLMEEGNKLVGTVNKNRLKAAKVLRNIKQTTSEAEIEQIVQDNLDTLDAGASEMVELMKLGITDEKKYDIFRRMAELAQRIDNVQTGDEAAMEDLIYEMARERHTKARNVTMNNLGAKYERGTQERFEYLNKFALKQLANIMDDYVPRTALQKANSWQKMAQLMNARTIGRNLAGNGSFYLLEMGSRLFAVPIDWAIGKLRHGERTVGAATPFGKGEALNQPSSLYTQQTATTAGARAFRQSQAEIALDVNVESNTSKWGAGSRRTWKLARYALALETADSLFGKVGRGIQFAGAWGLTNIEKFQGYALNSTDEYFKGAVYQSMMNSYAHLINDGHITFDTAVELARKEASYATFQDDTFPGMILQKTHDLLNGKLVVKMNDLQTAEAMGEQFSVEEELRTFGPGDFIVTYRTVPGALVSRTFEYSPLGVMKLIYNVGNLVNNRNNNLGTYWQHQTAMQFGRLTNGAMLLTVFLNLAMKGIIKLGDDDEDKNVKALVNWQGRSGIQFNWDAFGRYLKYQINLSKQDGIGAGLSDFVNWDSDYDGTWKENDALWDLGALEPFSSIIDDAGILANLLMTNKRESLTGEYGLGIGDIFDASKQLMANTVMDMSCMQTISDLFYTIMYHDNESDLSLPGEVMINLAVDSATGMWPSVIRQIAQGTDPYYRDSYNAGGPVEDWLNQDGTVQNVLRDKFGLGKDFANAIGTAANQVMTVIPGLRQQVPVKTNALGEEKKYSDSLFQNMVNAMVNPSKLTNYHTNDMLDEMERLYDATGDGSFYPERKVKNTYTLKGVELELTQEEKDRYQEVSGETYTRLANSVMASDEYKNATDAEKIEIMKDVKSYSEYKARQDLWYNSDERTGMLQGIRYDHSHNPNWKEEYDAASTYTSRDWNKQDQVIDLGYSFLDARNIIKDTTQDALSSNEASDEIQALQSYDSKVLQYLETLPGSDGRRSREEASDETKLAMYRIIRGTNGETNAGKIEYLMGEGIDFNTISDVRQVYNELDSLSRTEFANISSVNKETMFDHTLRNEFDLTEDQIEAVESQWLFRNMVPQQINSNFTTLTKVAGMDDDRALEIADGIASLEPLDGEDEVSNSQKYEWVIGNDDLTIAEKQEVIGSLTKQGDKLGVMSMLNESTADALMNLYDSLDEDYHNRGEYLPSGPSGSYTVNKKDVELSDDAYETSRETYAATLDMFGSGLTSTTITDFALDVASQAAKYNALKEMGYDVSLTEDKDIDASNFSSYRKTLDAQKVGISPTKFAYLYKTCTAKSGDDRKDQIVAVLKSANLSSEQYSYMYHLWYKN